MEHSRQNRITSQKPDGTIYANGMSINDIVPPLRGAIKKLRAYELIGQDPEDIEMFIALYDEKCEEVELLQSKVEELTEQLSMLAVG